MTTPDKHGEEESAWEGYLNSEEYAESLVNGSGSVEATRTVGVESGPDPDAEWNGDVFEGTLKVPMSKSMINQLYGKMSTRRHTRRNAEGRSEWDDPEFDDDPVGRSLNQIILDRQEEEEECVECGCLVHPDDDEFIRGSSDEPYCDVNCMNEALQP